MHDRIIFFFFFVPILSSCEYSIRTGARLPSVNWLIAANFSSNRVPEQVEVVTSIPNRVPLSTGQSMGRFCEPISMELPSQTYRSEMQIELSDSRTANEEARADSHAAPATRGSDERSQVSVAAPVVFYDLQGSNHNPRAQSTRYPLSLHPPHEKSTFVENTMDLTSVAYATDVIIPETTTGEATRGPSTIFDRTSFLPLPAFSLQPMSGIRQQATRGESAARWPPRKFRRHRRSLFRSEQPM